MSNGFTLLELMIVIAIIGILSVIAVPYYTSYIARAQLSEALSMMSGLKADMSRYYATYGVCPTNSTSGFYSSDKYSGKYVAGITLQKEPTGNSSIKDNTGNIIAKTICSLRVDLRSQGVSSLIAGKSLFLNFGVTTSGGAYVFGCDAAERANGGWIGRGGQSVSCAMLPDIR